MQIKIVFTLVFFLLSLTVGFVIDDSHAARFKVLVVMSYDPDYTFVQKVRQGIDSVLSDTCRIEYFYMDTKNNLAGGPQKAKAAFAMYQKMQPNGVIAADDNAQSMFVVPYLKNKVKTPVMFCGVNDSPENYGYPADNVSGILERMSITQSLAFAKQLIPTIRTFGYMSCENPTGRTLLKYFQHEAHTFPMKLVAARFPKTLMEGKAMAKELQGLCDVLFIPTMNGIRDDTGNPLSDRQVLPVITDIFAKPVIGDQKFTIQYGMLCGMTQHPDEQGFTAAKMLLKAMQGTPVCDIPITRNRLSQAIINVTVMKAFGIKPKPILLKDTELIRGEADHGERML
nr:ABC transporter substrate binding protein [uncultured Desulfobacter sp.]